MRSPRSEVQVGAPSLRPARSLVLLLLVALGVSACKSRSEADVTREPLLRKQPAGITAAPVAGKPPTPRSEAVPPAPVVPEPPSSRAPTSAPDKPARHAEPSSPSSTSAGPELEVKRLVVARAIEKREPVEAKTLVASDEPLFAFVELANRSEHATAVVVTFEREDSTSVGHVKLEVPAKASRWRTWGRTRQVRAPGTWHAVVRTADGAELGRKSFEVVSG